jgi:hypothetical protein
MVDELTVDAILDQRAETYGAFMDLAAIAVALRQVIRDRRPDLLPDEEEALAMICTKIARIVNGNGGLRNLDSWRDIAGYAQLVADRLEGRVR